MTREESIKYLKEMKDECNNTIHKVRYVTQEEALEMAIKALQEPSGDLISRQAVQDYIAKYLSQYLYDDVREAVEVIDEFIGDLPSVNPQEPTTKNNLGVDCVSRKAVHDMLENLPVTVEDKWFNWLQKACMRLAELPSATSQEPKTGYWILTDDDFVYCSECEDSYYPRPIDASWYYCPNCGARMVEQERSDKE